MALEIASQTISADGNGTAIVNSSRRALWIQAYGTFGGGTVKVQYSPNNGSTWIDITSATGTSDWYLLTYVPQGFLLRSVTTGSTAPSVTFSIVEAIKD